MLGVKDGLVAVRCKLYTGKTHQIRVHMKDVLGVEILNDKKYGRKKSKLAGCDNKTMFLHCQRIVLRYNKQEMKVDTIF